MTKDDVLYTLQHLHLVTYYKGQFVIALGREAQELYDKAEAKRLVRIDPKCLHWTPKDWTKRGRW